ncbi:HAD family hydrolase [Salarchaeum sp. JOR-1]|uniref:HAD family hydrolase n=1 Tax=Salarchaeum sp. JOR-1 TaxID=2599399 RepID=UPI0011983AF6|nr:HAD family hydrolase [Salarchaeum sp. JOR-1]QDX41642.1 HAD family hydrolase [Salarchaeum sp. JOR-1]
MDGVVYDLDGTLVDLPVDWRAVAADLRALLDSARVNPDDYGTWGLLDAAESAGVGGEAERIISEYEREGARTAESLPLADELAGSDVPAAVCSLNCEAACRIALSRHGLLDSVEAVVGRDSVAERKPHPEPLRAAVRALGVRPERVVFVGDAERDAETAERAGTEFRYVEG